ncbi:hypothetical protein [Clostridium vincentii]|uniref:Uncharacterized protein n=1 Tax=Clostridium vincentii TaxID=52704 RepID=A0A2T0BL21_9CLOT|nr:hypothetical protein [Clostridium vincentii]PRR84559.1 hypothetical protein CLVI_00820 [Clostridium vincentii]
MNKILKKTIKATKKLRRKGLIYIGDNINLKAEVNSQFIATIVEGLNIFMEEAKYEVLKNNKERLLHELVISGFRRDDLIYNFSFDFKMSIIKEFIDIEDPELVDGMYYFITNYGNLRELYRKALIQIKEEKFKNLIFN